MKDHVDPPSVVTTAAGPVWSPPTDMQKLADPHDTELSGASPQGFVVAAVHDDPPLEDRYCSLFPDATHAVAEEQATAVTVPVKPEGGCGRVWLDVQVEPPFVVNAVAPVALCPDPEEPATTQLEFEPQVTPFNIARLLGGVCEVQVVPAFEVPISTGLGGPEPPPLALPIAMHDVADPHETEFKNPTPDGKVCKDQEEPPLVVTKITPAGGIPDWVPAAKHVVALGHEIPERLTTAEGTVWLAQVEPPFVVAINCTGAGPEPDDADVPRAKQVEEVGQETAERDATEAGAVWDVQVCAPLVVASIIALPLFVATIQQSDELAHDTAL